MSDVGFYVGCRILTSRMSGLTSRMSDFYKSDVGFNKSDVGFLQIGCRI